jgi:hypothetical protein
VTRTHEWELSGLSLVTDSDDPPASGHWFETYADGVSLGEAEPSNSIRETLALDGDDVRTDRFGNREIVFTVAICGYTNDDLAAGERELAPRIGTQGFLRFVPPDGPVSLYWVRTSRMAVQFDDLGLIYADKYMAYQVTLNCEPWAYPEDITTEVFTPGTASYSIVDACAATTNWTGFPVAAAAVTFLSVSAIRVGPVTATGAYTGGGGGGPGNPQWIPPPGAALTATASGSHTFTGTVPAANYMYVDVAGTVSAGGSVNPPLLSVNGGPLTSSLANVPNVVAGYTRHFWQRSAGPLVFLSTASGMANGDTANFYIGEFGTSNVLPSTSVYTLTTAGSVRTNAKLQLSHPSTPGLGETLIYTDPSMLANGWNPGDSTTWANAPDGTYWVYVQPTASYNSGDVFSVTIAGQTATTRTEHSQSDSHWIPLGPFQLGGRKSRRLGTQTGLGGTVALLKNGVGTGYTAVAARLIREHEDSALTHVWLSVSSPTQSLFIEPATIDQATPGIFSGTTATGLDATSVLTLTKSWGWPRLIPSVTALWIQCANTLVPIATVTHRPPYHSLAP